MSLGRFQIGYYLYHKDTLYLQEGGDSLEFDKNSISYYSINGGETDASAASHLHICRQQLRLAKPIFMRKRVLCWCGEVWIRLKDPNAGDVC